MEKVFEIYIKTTPERLWEAITDPELRRKYNFGVARSRTGRRARRTARPSARGRPHLDGENLEWTRRTGSCRASTPSGATT